MNNPCGSVLFIPTYQLVDRLSPLNTPANAFFDFTTFGVLSYITLTLIT